MGNIERQEINPTRLHAEVAVACNKVLGISKDAPGSTTHVDRMQRLVKLIATNPQTLTAFIDLQG